MRRLLIGAAMLCAAAFSNNVAYAESLLDTIISRGKIVVGVFPAAPPFGTTNAQGEIEGIDIEIARLLAEDLGVELETIATNGAARIPTMMTGKADILIAVMSITPERAKQVAFSIPYTGFEIIMYGPQDQKVESWADLAGKRVGVTLGAVTDIETTRNAPPGTEIIRFEDDAATNTALLAGQVDVICQSDFVVMDLPARAPDRHFENKFSIRSSPISIGMRRGDPDLLQWVNTWIYYNQTIGKIDAIYQKHMGRPLPDFGTF